MTHKVMIFGMVLLLAQLCWFPGFVQAQEQSGPELIPKKQSDTSMNTGTMVAAPTVSPTPGSDSATPKKSDSTGSFSTLFEGLPMGMIVMGMLIGGFVLLFIELALIPGFGFVGFTGLGLIFGGLGLAFWRLDSQTAVIYTVVSLIGFVLMGLWIFFVFPHTSLGKRFVLHATISVAEGYSANQDFSRLVGVEGVASSDLRPSGIARLAEERVDVISDGDFIPRGTKIKVLKIKNGNVVVVPMDQPKA